jgi:hypothetical protein
MKPMNRRSLVSFSTAACFLALSATGLLLYFLKHSMTTAAIHTSFGAVFLIAAALHISNNFKPLKGYTYKRGEKPYAFIQKEIYIVVLPALLLLAGLFYELPGFAAVYDWGNEWRLQQENKQESKLIVQSLETNPAGRGPKLELHVMKGKAMGYAMFAVWIEDLSGHYLHTLYVSRVIGTSVFTFGKEDEGGEWVPAVVRRPEGLPYWGHQRGVQARDGYFLPDPDSPVPDAVTGATPNESFRLTTRMDEPLTTFRILLEVNQSFDWNDYYSKTRFPDDKIYSGSGQNGQPSVIYAATIDLSQGARYHAMNPAGHGHHSGQDGKLYTDMSNLTTALDIVDSALVKIIQ